ncbi:MAG: Glycosyltransferase involved in cell wall bisynthesis [Thermodesulfobacteria bacterium]|nr:glycosyltransferase family 2 protein [Thermodesulfobacteriota bacterium]MCU4138769.1 Glycosyltransferase involved in cell wall bisynthesis [Thermodesulfobacteriota bacterium]
MKKISLVIPVHNEEKNIPIVYKEIKAVLEELSQEKNYTYEIIFVNDGSSDNTLEVLKNFKKSDSFLRILNMDKNRGQSAGLTAGFYYARGDIVVTMDGDGQNDPQYIKELIKKIEEGYQVVTGYRIKRKEPFLTRILPSRIANWLISLITGLKVRDNGCSLKAYISPIPKKFQIPRGFHRFLPALFGVKNEEVYEIPVIDRPRFYGKTHYNLKRTFEVIRDLLTIPFILKDPIKFEKIFKYLFILFFIILLFLFLYLNFSFSFLWILIESFFLILSGFSYIIWKNLKRFNKAQKEGVFKVEEIF